ncbi:TonB-dependent receptor [Acidomonas methanolica]|uniref:TonB-dependent receptor n=1 Tax=Acidomonas methanolica NBRC 104435 TaxID=1231351 RepID=A0A023D3E7_ACIMT|nr:TonB-dependent receptor [Acidomonas methanolica]MBU2654454.1 TonB-dependent receptor [Acidomonas methanolica]GAJ28609.1 TonB-dependent receptor [Acidomonas methanolica NBRC 104435]GEK98974.1 membrane protein [Acidomonas methanolica NBRC 104435]
MRGNRALLLTSALVLPGVIMIGGADAATHRHPVKARHASHANTMLAQSASPSPAAPVASSAQTAQMQAPTKTQPVLPAPQSETIDVIGITPLMGTGISREKVPSSVQVLTDKDLLRYGHPDLIQAMDGQLAGVNMDSASGNPYQPTMIMNGFEASPLQGTPQGIAVYMNGVRFNQAFGDTVNWDMIPTIAIKKMEVQTANPVYGLNALGGSVNMRMKDGFNTGNLVEADLSGGQYGQIQANGQFSHKWRDWSVYVAAREEHQEGWRDLQSTDIQNLYSDLGYKHGNKEFHANLVMANSTLNGPGTSPIQLLQADPAAQFTAPNAIGNKYLMFDLKQGIDITPTLHFQALEYYSYFQQLVSNGNAPNDSPCNDGTGLLCQSPGNYSTSRNGATIPAYLGSNPYSYNELDDQTTNTNSYGATFQEISTHKLFGLKNNEVAGFSFNGSQTMFSATSYIGGVTPLTRSFIGPGVVLDESGNVPVRVGIQNNYYGIYGSDTLSLTDRLSLTVAGRINIADVNLSDKMGGDLTGNHHYTHFNPSAGLTYRFTNWLSGFASFAENNRAPTPAELSCASPQDSCSLANFFVGDPNLRQVITHTYEIGLRGHVNIGRGALVYEGSIYRTNAQDDIAFINSVTLNRAFFQNVGDTRRQGAKLHLAYNTDWWTVYLNYTFNDATYRTTYVESGGSNPQADANGNLTIRPGDRLAGIPKDKLTGGADFRLTPKLTFGANFVLQSGQYLYGDEANLTPELPGFFTVNLHGTYQITKNLQFFAQVSNIGNRRYYTYGTFSPANSVYLWQVPNATNPRAYSPAMPISGYGGLRLTF